MRMPFRAGIVLLMCGVGSHATADTDRSALDAAVREVKDGAFEDAAIALDGVIRDLAGRPELSGDLAQAYVYLGVAYLGLGQEGLARNKFRLALKQQPDLRLGTDEFSAKTLRFFDEARKAEQASTTLAKDSRKGRGKGGLIVLGLGGAAAAAIGAAVIRKERENLPPTASLAITPQGQAIARITVLGFSASGSDADGDALRFSWAFGDGARAEGPSVTHVYPRMGEFTIALTASDGLAETTVPGTVTARTLTGSWRPAGSVFSGAIEYRIGEEGSIGEGRAPLSVLFTGGRSNLDDAGVTIRNPREVRLDYSGPDPSRPGRPNPACSFRFEGQADSTLQTLTGSLACFDASAGDLCEECRGRQQPLTLSRQ